MTLSCDIKVEGFEELGKKLEPDELLGDALKHVLGQAALMVEREAKIGTPVDTGRLWASWVSIVDASPVPLWAKVHTDVPYTLFVEEDTRPHFPPPHALEGWAHRHGIPTFAICIAIARHGTKGKHMLAKAVEKTQEKLGSILKEAENMIKERFNKEI